MNRPKDPGCPGKANWTATVNRLLTDLRSVIVGGQKIGAGFRAGKVVPKSASAYARQLAQDAEHCSDRLVATGGQ